MISGIFHQGSGLGNQLHRYVATRVLAEDKGYEFGMIGRENFKGSSFMNLDFGKEPQIAGCFLNKTSGKVTPFTEGPDGPRVICPIWEEKTNYYNPDFNFIEDNTIIDGEFQDERYFEHHLAEIDKWLQTEKLEMDEDMCVIGFRGGEFKVFPELFLPESYWQKAVDIMHNFNPNMRFEVHTDDPETAFHFFPEFPIIHDIGINWRSMRYAKYAIIANSSFYIFPRLLGYGTTIAPRWWDRHNLKKWERPYNYYKSFTYIE